MQRPKRPKTRSLETVSYTPKPAVESAYSQHKDKYMYNWRSTTNLTVDLDSKNNHIIGSKGAHGWPGVLTISAHKLKEIKGKRRKIQVNYVHRNRPVSGRERDFRVDEFQVAC